MAKNYFIALDLGTSNIRCAILDEKGTVLKLLSKNIKPSYPKTSYAEYNAKTFLKEQISLLNKTINSLPKSSNVLGLGIASQRSTIVLWDKKTGVPLCPALSWQDGRAGSVLNNINITQEETHKITGLYKTPYYSAPKIKWCMENYRSVKIAHKNGNLFIGSLATYLVWHLSGKKTFAIDPTMAQRTLLFNINTFSWSRRLLKAFNIQKTSLPKITPTTADFGAYIYKARKIPIITIAGDQQAAAVGFDTTKGQSVLNYGTGAFLLVNNGNIKPTVKGMLTSVNCQSQGHKPSYSLEGVINSAASLFEWLKQLGLKFDTKKLDYYCAHSGTNPLMFPALGGLGSPYWDFNTNVTITGLTAKTKKEDIIKAALQGIAFLIADIAAYLKLNKVKIKSIYASGGLSKSDYILGFQSDLMQTKIFRTKETETTIKGVYSLMAKHLHIRPKKETAANIKTFVPKMTASQAKRLLSCWQKFMELSREISKI